MGIKLQGREADHSPPSSAEVKEGGAIPPLLHMSSWHTALLIKHRQKLFIWFSGSINGADPFEGILQKFIWGVRWTPSVKEVSSPDEIRNGYFTITILEH
jgi:hypothetical protein